MELTTTQTHELKQALKDKTLSAYHKRLQVILFRSQGMSCKTISERLDVSHYTIWRLTKVYQANGIQSLMTETRGGRHRSYMTLEDEQVFLKEQLERSSNGDFVTVQEMFEAYQKRVGHPTTREGFYALLKRHGWRKVSPRPEHPKKADAKTILASKNKIFVQES